MSGGTPTARGGAGYEIVRIADATDPRLGVYAALTDAALRKRFEHEQGVLIAEGPNPVRALVASPYPVRSVLVAERRLELLDTLWDARHDPEGPSAAADPVPAYVVSQEVLEELVRFRLHQGILACGGRLSPPTPARILAGARRILVLEGLNDHENLGTLFRTARAFATDAVLLGPGCADPLYRRSVRVSMGHVLHLPFARTGSIHDALAEVRAAGATVVALTPDPAAVAIDEAADLRDRPLALLLGAEGPGLTTAALAGADVAVRIPIAAAVDSLNVAAAGAVACHVLRPSGR